MRPQQKRLDDLESLLTVAVRRLEDARQKVAIETAGHEGKVDGLTINRSLAENARNALAKEKETLVATYNSLQAEMSAVARRISENDEESVSARDAALEASASLTKATAELEAVRAKDRPLVTKWENEVAKIQRRITTVRAHKPALKALFPGGTEEPTGVAS